MTLYRKAFSMKGHLVSMPCQQHISLLALQRVSNGLNSKMKLHPVAQVLQSGSLRLCSSQVHCYHSIHLVVLVSSFHRMGSGICSVSAYPLA